MGYFSILPPSLAAVETWIGRIFLIAALFTIGPWLIAMVYDLLLYIARRIHYEIPVYGGRARGHHRPRAPSLSEPPGDRLRRLSAAAGIGADSSASISSPPSASHAPSDKQRARRREPGAKADGREPGAKADGREP